MNTKYKCCTETDARVEAVHYGGGSSGSGRSDPDCMAAPRPSPEAR